MNSICPEVDPAEKIALARQVVFELLAEARIELRKIEWPEDEGPSLDAEQVARLRHDDLPWHDPEHCAELLVQVNKTEA